MKITGPGWPDMKGWVVLGIFGLVYLIFHQIEINPRLLANASYMQLITGIIGTGGLALIVSNLFTSQTPKKPTDGTVTATPPAGGSASASVAPADPDPSIPSVDHVLPQ